MVSIGIVLTINVIYGLIVYSAYYIRRLLMKYKENWEETKERFIGWWNHSNIDRPLMRVVSKRKTPVEIFEEVEKSETIEDRYLDIDRKAKRLRNYCRMHNFMAESFPVLDTFLGAGSVAAYLGSELVFSSDTIWFEDCIDDLKKWGGLRYNPENTWWKKHLQMTNRARELAGEDFPVGIPDLVENMDILSSLRGAQNLCFDLMDEPELIKKYLSQIDDLYFEYYNQIYDIVKDRDGSCIYSAFSVWGPGRVAKIQCDFSAMLSPTQFREFVQPSLRKQCQKLDFSLYHLDGPDAIRHLEALMEIDELNALQWTAGAGQPDGGSEKWYTIYDQVIAANKSLWVMLSDGGINDWLENADKLVKRYGPEKLYFLFPDMEEDDALRLIAKAERDWK
jgi:5-methyltetrahydrofolate--homocysteine methyltransferase